MRSRITPLLLGAQVLFVLCMGAMCESVTQETCGSGFNDTRGAVSVGEFGDSEDAMKLEAFLGAIANFEAEAAQLTADTEAACRSLGEDLGVPDDDMPVGDVEATCSAVAATIDEYMQAFAEANLTVSIEVTEGQCSADFQASANCYADCDVNVDIEATPPTCTGGTLWVECSGGCSGECRLPSATAECYGYCEGQCSGSCDATCSGSCSGTCQGFCEGACDATDESGNCNGTCTGTCRGQCSATCEGSCSGSCTGSCSAGCVVEVDGGGCEGECHGGCDVEATPLRCEGGEFNVDASAECQAACEADVSFEAECTPPQVVVAYSGDAEAVLSRAEIFAAAIENNLPEIEALIAQLGYVLESVGALVDASADGLGAAVRIGARSIACTALAIDLAVQVEIEVNVSVTATADVSASATAG